MNPNLVDFFTPTSVLDEIYDILGYVMSYLELSRVTYFATQGTLLGVMRYNAILPWDVDADICVVGANDLFRRPSFIKYLKAKGLHICKIPNIEVYQLCKQRRLKNSSRCAYPTVDIVLLKKNNGNYILDMSKYIKNRYKKDDTHIQDETYMHDDIFPLRRRRFGSLMIPCPRKTVAYLDKQYPGWKDKAIISFIYDKTRNSHERYLESPIEIPLNP